MSLPPSWGRKVASGDMKTPMMLPGAILFDMDGTLTEPMLDFPKIKSEMGIGSRPILEALAEMDLERRGHAEGILLRHEDHAAAHSALNPGCRELLGFLHGRRIATALITRNSRRSMRIVVDRHGLKFDAMISREDGPFKPDPYPLQHACRTLAIPESSAWMVGDGQYDMEAAWAAGVWGLWVSHGRKRHFEAMPWIELRDLPELHRLLAAIEAGKRHDASNQSPGPDGA